MNPTKKAPRRREALAGNFLYRRETPAAESRDAERGTRAALSVLVFIRFAVCFNHSDIFRKIENGGFDQFIQAVGIKGKALFP